MDSSQTILATLRALAVSVKASEMSHSAVTEFGHNDLADRMLNIARPAVVSRILEPFIHELIRTFHLGVDSAEQDRLYTAYAKAYDIFYAEID